MHDESRMQGEARTWKSIQNLKGRISGSNAAESGGLRHTAEGGVGEGGVGEHGLKH